MLDRVDGLRQEILEARLGRREVLRRATVLGLSAPVIAGLLAACGSDEDEDPTATSGAAEPTGTTGGAQPDATATEAGAEPTEAGEEPTEAGEEPTEAAEEPTATTGGGSGMTRGQFDLVRILYWQAPTILTTHYAQGDKDSSASSLVLEPLIYFDNDGNVVPLLVTEVPSFENGLLAEDGLSVTYNLLPDVVWSDGEPFTANDVRFTWEFVVNPDSSCTSVATYQVIEDVEVVDDLTVTIHFTAPNPAWYGPFSTGYAGQVLPQHILQDFVGAAGREAPFNLNPIGTGPYKVVEFKPGDVCTYEVNENYREADKPYFSQVEFKGGGDATSAAQAAMRTGEVDYSWNLQVQADVLAELEETAETGELLIVLGTSLERILINFADPRTEVDGAFSEPSTQHPWQSDLAVRQAYTYICDRETIATELYGVTGTSSSNVLNGPTRFVSPNTSFEFNPETAAAMLDEAGWVVEDGQRTKDGVKMEILYQTSTNPVRQKTQEIIKQAMEGIGIPVEIKAIDAAVYFSSDAGNPDTSAHFYADWEMFTNSTTVPYPIAYMANYKSVDPAIDVAQKANTWSGGNYYRWINDEYNALYTQAEVELDEATQSELFIAMNDLVVEQVVEIPLVHRAQVSAKAITLQGVIRSQWCPETYDVQNWYLEEE